MDYTGLVSVRQTSHVDVFAPDWICTPSPVLPPSSTRSYARCLTRSAPVESANNNSETTQLNRDENLLKKTSLKLRSRVVKKTVDTNSTPVFVPPHQPKSEWKPDVVPFEEIPDLRLLDIHGNGEDFSRDDRVEDGDTSEVFQPAWLRQRETPVKDEGEADVDSVDDKIPEVKKKKKSKACKAWRMKVHSLKDTDEEEDKVHFAPTWMKKMLSNSDDGVIATNTMTHCKDGHEFNIQHNDGVGTKLKTSVVSERSTEEPFDNFGSKEEDTIGPVKETGAQSSSSARSVQNIALIGQSEGEMDSLFQVEHTVSSVEDTCSWSKVYHPELGRQIKEFIFQVLLGAVVSFLVEEVTRNSLKETAEREERKEGEATEGQDGRNERQIDTHDVLVQDSVSNGDGVVYNTAKETVYQTHDVNGGKSAACCRKSTSGLGSNQQGQVQFIINTNGTMASTKPKSVELVVDNSPLSDQGSAPRQNVRRDAGSLDDSLEAKSRGDEDSSFESILDEETLINYCLQEDARENGYAASVAIIEDAEGDGLIADVRLLWMLDEDEDVGDEVVDGDEDDGDGGDGGDGYVEEKEETEDVADGIDDDDGPWEDELMTDVQPPWESIDLFNVSINENSRDEDPLEGPHSFNQTILEAPDCKIKSTADATDITTVRIQYKNLTHILTNPGRDSRRPQIVLELDVLTTPGHFEKRRLEFYRFAETFDRKLRFRKPFRSRTKKYRRKVCETLSSVHSLDEDNNICDLVFGDGPNINHLVAKGKNRKIAHKNLLRKSKLPKWKRVKRWFR
ncbi:uncharacterized protein [Asterias amurensis]|uniref:uncharacterized protein isoform X2 n=1 Tax=Asterias amurensis TaxID=7602 RepID=UPI003AB85B27